ncbi:MFS transporter [Lysobacter koreensis]|uniref:MFS transporter n=1 Tax=Lysobacter koreensis TaxID=266122 RepID=A0ABW2YP65_9GAMM
MPPAQAAAPASHPSREVRLLLIGRGLRAAVDGFVAVLLPAYLLALGFDVWHVGVLSSATLLGSALMTLAVGRWGHRLPHGRLLRAAGLLMALTGFAFAGLSAFWPLLLVAFVGTLNPSAGDVSVFLPLEHMRLANAVQGPAAQGPSRTTLFARYSLVAALCAALGSLAAAAPEALVRAGIGLLPALRGMFVVYGLAGVAIWLLYARLPPSDDDGPHAPPVPLRESRRIVARLAALFSIDAFAGGLLVQSLLALWLFERFGLSLAQAATFFFWSGLLSALSQLAAPRVARRIGLLNTMVFTHIPASLALIAAAFAPSMQLALGLLFVRAALSQMDVPTRAAFVMAVVSPSERSAAASYTAVPRSLASALSPSLGGALFAAGWLAAPLLACGVLKIAYDLTLLAMFRGVHAEE